MSLKARFLVLMGVLLLAFVGCLAAMRYVELKAINRILQSTADDRQENLDRIVALTGESLRTFSTDYSLWDEMYAFLGTHDPVWASFNIDAPLVTFNAAAAWVFLPDGSNLYTATRLPGAEADLKSLFPPGRVRAITSASKLPHFFVEIPSGMLEIRGAGIVPSDDVTRESAPRGWFFVARHWSPAVMGNLARLTDSEVRLGAPGDPPPFPDHPFAVQFRHELRDFAGRPLSVLHFDYHVEKVRQIIEADHGELILFVGYGVISTLLTVLALLRWVIRPLDLVSHSLAAGDATSVTPLLSRSDELGSVAQLVRTSAVQRASLESMLGERARLGRNLHDSVIQTIYACGMGLSSVRVILRENPAEAERLMDHLGEQFNSVIHDLRSFIMGLEPEDFQRRTFREAIDAIAAFFRSIRTFESVIEIDDQIVPLLSPHQRVHILHITRECISNALRHGQATRILISLRRSESGISFEIADNGHGFDPLDRSAPGRKGLANLAERAKDLAGQLHIESSPRDGTRIQVLIPSSLSPV